MSVRLLVTGSRKWDHLPSIGSTLEHFTHAAFQLGSRLTVVHGAAVSGADAIAASWASTRNRNGWPVDVEPHPADWRLCTTDCRPGHRIERAGGGDYCPYAGHRRNQEMVDAGAAMCVAFWRGGSSGTRHCFSAADEAKMPVFKIRWHEHELITPEWLASNAPRLEPSCPQ